ncbi:hypothetical protein CR513_59348, partial [Mucuna pruriens]
MGANLQEWCEFHRTYGHSTEDYRTLQEHIERLIQEAHLGQYIRRGNEEALASPRPARTMSGGESSREARHDPKWDERRRERSLRPADLEACVEKLYGLAGEQPSRVGKPNINVLDLDLDPRCEDERERPLLVEDLKEANIGYKTKIGTTLTHADESHIVAFLWENRDVFAWSPANMPRIDLDFLCHRLSISLN